MEAIHQTEVQYVRCIKPNSNKSSAQFSRAMVVEQLRSAGMIEAIRISRAAYPYKMSQIDFIRRFAGLHTSKTNEKINAKTYCQNILTSLLTVSDAIIPIQANKNVSTKMYEIGKTKVYFSSGILEKLEAKRARFLSDSVKFIQKVVRGLKQRKIYLSMRKSCIHIQKSIR
jgi:myosin-5